MAKKYFGEESAIPENSHLQFDLLFSKLLSGAEWKAYFNNWQRFGAFTYVVLQEGKSIKEVEAKQATFNQALSKTLI